MFDELLTVATWSPINEKPVSDLHFLRQETVDLQPIITTVDLLLLKTIIHFELLYLVIQRRNNALEFIVLLLESTLVRHHLQGSVEELIAVLAVTIRRRHQLSDCIVNNYGNSLHVVLIAKISQETLFHSALVGNVVLNMHEGLNLFHLVNILARLFLADIHFILLRPFDIFPISLLQSCIDVVDHDPVLDFDVVLERDREVTLLQ